MYCSQCGNDVAKDSKFCDKCGKQNGEQLTTSSSAGSGTPDTVGGISKNKWATPALVMGIASVFLNVVSFPLFWFLNVSTIFVGAIGLTRSNRLNKTSPGNTGFGKSLTGLISGIVCTIGGVII